MHKANLSRRSFDLSTTGLDARVTVRFVDGIPFGSWSVSTEGRNVELEVGPCDAGRVKLQALLQDGSGALSHALERALQAAPDEYGWVEYDWRWQRPKACLMNSKRSR